MRVHLIAYAICAYNAAISRTSIEESCTRQVQHATCTIQSLNHTYAEQRKLGKKTQAVSDKDHVRDVHGWAWVHALTRASRQKCTYIHRRAYSRKHAGIRISTRLAATAAAAVGRGNRKGVGEHQGVADEPGQHRHCGGGSDEIGHQEQLDDVVALQGHPQRRHVQHQHQRPHKPQRGLLQEHPCAMSLSAPFSGWPQQGRCRPCSKFRGIVGLCTASTMHYAREPAFLKAGNSESRYSSKLVFLQAGTPQSCNCERLVNFDLRLTLA